MQKAKGKGKKEKRKVLRPDKWGFRMTGLLHGENALMRPSTLRAG